MSITKYVLGGGAIVGALYLITIAGLTVLLNVGGYIPEVPASFVFWHLLKVAAPVLVVIVLMGALLGAVLSLLIGREK